MDFHPQDLRYFMEVGQMGNLSHAAVRLGVSQPSISVAMKRLEDTMGTPLLIRSRKGVQLTPAGRQLMAKGRSFLEAWEDLCAKPAAVNQEVSGHYVIGCHSAVGLYSLPTVIAQMMVQYPQLHLELRHDLSRKILEAVANVRMDFGVIINPVRHPDLILKKVGTDIVTFWQRSDIKKGVETTLICDPDILQTQSLMKQAKKMGRTFDRVIPTSSLEMVTELTIAGAGVGVIPNRVVKRNAEAASLITKKGAPIFNDEIFVAYRVENRSIRALQLMSDQVADWLRSVN